MQDIVCFKHALGGSLFVIIIPNICLRYLEEGGVTLQLGGAERSHRTQVGPEVDVGEQRTGSEQQTRRSLHKQNPK